MTTTNRSKLHRGVMSDSAEQLQTHHVAVDGDRVRVALKLGQGTP